MARLALLLACAACAACTQHGETIGRTALVGGVRTSGGFNGLHANAAAGSSGLSIGLGASWDELSRPMDPDRHAAGSIELTTRLSLFGMLADDHRVEHWFDIGVEGGGGGGFAHPAALEGFGELWSGAWIDIGLLSGPSCPALALGVRTYTISGPWNGEAIATVGLAWVARTMEPMLSPM